MKYSILAFILLYSLSASAETLSGHVLQVRDNVAYVKTTDGKKFSLILDDKTYYRKRKITKKGNSSFEFYQPLMGRGDNITFTYDAEKMDTQNNVVKASDVLIMINN